MSVKAISSKNLYKKRIFISYITGMYPYDSIIGIVADGNRSIQGNVSEISWVGR